jgi:hypothetical protein
MYRAMDETMQSKGGRVRAEKLTAERRREIARGAAAARWGSRTPVATKVLRFEPALWDWVEARAEARKVTANAWLVRCILDARARLEKPQGSVV